MKPPSEDKLNSEGKNARRGERASFLRSQGIVASRGGIGDPSVKSLDFFFYLIFFVWRSLASISVSSVDPENLQHEITLNLSQVLTKLPMSLVLTLDGFSPKPSDMVNSCPADTSPYIPAAKQKDLGNTYWRGHMNRGT